MGGAPHCTPAARTRPTHPILPLSPQNPLPPDQREEARTLLATVEELTADGLGAALARYSVTAPETGNALTSPYAFNLMFKTWGP